MLTAFTARPCPAVGVAVTAVPAAHEALELDEAGRCRCLGYVVRIAGLAVHHAATRWSTSSCPRCSVVLASTARSCLFAFNTASPDDLELLRECRSPLTHVPDVARHLVLTPPHASPESRS